MCFKIENAGNVSNYLRYNLDQIPVYLFQCFNFESRCKLRIDFKDLVCI